LAPLATFDPWLPNISQKNDSQQGYKASAMIDFAKQSTQKDSDHFVL